MTIIPIIVVIVMAMVILIIMVVVRIILKGIVIVRVKAIVVVRTERCRAPIFECFEMYGIMLSSYSLSFSVLVKQKLLHRSGEGAKQKNNSYSLIFQSPSKA